MASLLTIDKNAAASSKGWFAVSQASVWLFGPFDLPHCRPYNRQVALMDRRRPVRGPRNGDL
jgi:hypothetical protein